LRREAEDLQLLRCEFVERAQGPLAGVLACRLQLDSRALGEGFHPEVHEAVVRDPELLARVEAPPLASLPFAVQQVGAGEVGPAPPPGPPAGAGFAPVVARALPSVVQIRSPRGLGSGVVLDAAGYVVTSAHVVAGARSFRVTLADGSQDSATLHCAFPQGDLAVVQLHGARPRPATFADSSRVRVGDYALAIGNPLGLRSSVTQGVVSSTSRMVPRAAASACASTVTPNTR
jgi:S1-C subfamily serine protease